jgi:hypothetical protein
MNSPAVPPVNPNWFASDDLREQHLFTDQSYAEGHLQSFLIDFDRQLTKYDRAKEKD